MRQTRFEHFQKNYSPAVGESEGGLFEFWLRFGSVTGFFKPAPSPKPRQNSKILAPHGYNFSSNALIACVTTLLALGLAGASGQAQSGPGTASAGSAASSSAALATLKQIKTIFVIPLENHDLVQSDPTGSPQQLLGNPACPYFNSLITPGNANSAQTAYATHYYSVAIDGEHPSEPNYIWSEAGTDFGVRFDDDPSDFAGNVFTNVQHLSGQLTEAGIPWRCYQEDVQYSTSELVSASGSGVPPNPYNGTTEYNYAVKHNPMAFFTDTQNKNVYPLTNLWSDLANNNIGRYNWITPDQYNEMHSALPGGYKYHGVLYTGNQAAIAEGDNALSILVPKIMASPAYKDHGVIIIWTDETESTDDTNTTLPYVIISPLARGNAYASTLPYSHASDLKTMDEIFGLAYQTNAIPETERNAQNTGYNYVNGSSAVVNDLSDFFVSAPVSSPARQ
jgi:phosphatidylinositol-3-phosphatase